MSAAAVSSTPRTAVPACRSHRSAAGTAATTTAPAASSALPRSAAPRPVALFGELMQLLGHRRQELPGDLGVALDERPEVPRRHAVADHVRLGGDRRRPVGAGEERDLAEVVAGADRAAGCALDGHLGLAGLDDEEA